MEPIIHDCQPIKRLSSGSGLIDSMICGGYECDCISTIFGPAGSGKTCLSILAAISAVRAGKKAIYIDTEGGFSVERFKQLCRDSNPEQMIKNIIFFKPLSFENQTLAFDKIKKIINDNIGLIVVDSIAMLYRLEFSKSEGVPKINRTLSQQISYLSEIARIRNIPVLITNQVYSDFNDKERTKMVGGDVLKYGSKTLLELAKMLSGKRRCFVRKHRSISSEISVTYKIVDAGIVKDIE